MARQPLIGTFGTLRPTSGGSGQDQVLKQIAGLSSSAGDIAYSALAKKAEEKGRLEGLKSVKKEGGKVVPPELRDSTFSIEDQAFNQAAILAHRAEVQTDAKARLDQLQRDYETDPAKFQLVASAYKDGVLSGMPEELAAIISSDIDSSIASRKSALDDAFYKSIKQANEAKLRAGLESFSDDILNATRSGDTARVEKLSTELEAMLNTAVDSRLIDPIEAENIREGLRERGAEQSAIGEIDRIIFNDELSIEDRIKKGMDFYDSLSTREIKDLSPEQKDSLTRLVGAKVMDLERRLAEEKTKQNIETERAISNLKIDAHNSFDTLESIIARTEKMFNDEKISGNERTSIINDALSGHGAAMKKQADFTAVAKKLTEQYPELVLDQKSVDAYYNEIYSPTLENLSPVEKNAAQASYVRILKAVPTAMKDQIKNNLLSGNTDLIAESSQLIDMIDTTAGLTDMVVEPSQRAFASIISGLMNVMEPREAALKAMELTSPTNTARTEARKAEIKQDKLDKKYESWVESGFESLLGANYLQKNINKERVETEFSELFEPLYMSGMDKDKAKNKAIELLQRNWKESDFGFMKHPPGDYYAVSGKTDYIRDQLYAELTGPSGIAGVNFKKDDMYLISDKETTYKASTGNPDYIVVIKDENGEFVSLGKGMRWHPDRNAEQQRQLKENEQKGKESRAKRHFSETTKETQLGQFFEKVLKDFK